MNLTIKQLYDKFLATFNEDEQWLLKRIIRDPTLLDDC